MTVDQKLYISTGNHSDLRLQLTKTTTIEDVGLVVVMHVGLCPFGS